VGYNLKSQLTFGVQIFLKECQENQLLDSKKKKFLKFPQLEDIDQNMNIFNKDFLEK
jgi:hypothetical protein